MKIKLFDKPSSEKPDEPLIWSTLISLHQLQSLSLSLSLFPLRHIKNLNNAKDNLKIIDLIFKRNYVVSLVDEICYCQLWGYFV